MYNYQLQDSSQTLAQAIQEYNAVHARQLRTRHLSAAAVEFFRCHDVVHVVFGCDITLRDEAIVKINSVFGTTAGLGVLRGYSLAESKEVYETLKLGEILTTTIASFVLIPRTIWRCRRMEQRWLWDDFDPYWNIPLNQIRRQFGIRVAHFVPT